LQDATKAFSDLRWYRYDAENLRFTTACARWYRRGFPARYRLLPFSPRGRRLPFCDIAFADVFDEGCYLGM
jgi:hypothetical protein